MNSRIYELNIRKLKYKDADGKIFYALVFKDFDYNFILAGMAALENLGFKTPEEKKISLLTSEPHEEPGIDFYKVEESDLKDVEEVNFCKTQSVKNAISFSIENEYKDKSKVFSILKFLNKDIPANMRTLEVLENEV